MIGDAIPMKSTPFDLRELVRDTDSVFLYSDSIPLGTTLPLTVGEAAQGLHTSVAGCYEVLRDFVDVKEEILDPDGNQPYAAEMKYGTYVEMTRCVSKHHRGRKEIPSVEFEDGADKCRRCQRMEEFLKRGRSPIAQSRKWYRQMHADARRKTNRKAV